MKQTQVFDEKQQQQKNEKAYGAKYSRMDQVRRRQL